jgi:pimeloyl-ACP methyl ester carboxylesterase
MVLSLFSPAGARRLPWMIDRLASGDRASLVQLAMVMDGNSRLITAGLLLTIQCSEEVPFNRRPPMITAMTDLFEACDGWPRNPVPTDLRAPFVSDVPTLIIVGDLDPVTPPAQAAAMAALFRRSQIVIVPHGSHDFPPAACFSATVVSFLETGTATGRCESVAALPFYVP